MQETSTQNQPDENKQIVETSVVPEPEFLPEDEYINRIINGNCLDILKRIPDNAIDLIVTDPPYGISFMNADWDKQVPDTDVWRESLRVLKPGGLAFVMSSARQDTLCEMVMNLSQAGFQTNFSSVYWTYSSGVPKGQNIAKTIAKQMGPTSAEGFEGAYAGFQPKPAVEVIIVAMKPCAENSFYRQALANNKGITHMGKCMIPYSAEEAQRYKNAGRFPANLLVSDNALKDYSRYFSLDQWGRMNLGDLPERDLETLPHLIIPKASTKEKEAGLDDLECKKISMGGKESFAPQRPTSKQRKNSHPTVKPFKLAAYLVKLGSVENDNVLDLFVGSGTTCIAAAALNRRYIGIEISSEYCEIARRRIEHVQREMASGGNEMIEGIHCKTLPSSEGKDSPIEHAREKVISHPAPEIFSRTVEKPKASPDVSKGSPSPFASMRLPPMNAGSSGGKQALSNSLEGFVASQKQSKASMSLPQMNAAAVGGKPAASNSLAGLFVSKKQSNSTKDVPKGSPSPFTSMSLPPMNAGSSDSKQASLNSLGGMFKSKKQVDGMIEGAAGGVSRDVGSDRHGLEIPPWMLEYPLARHPEETVARRSPAKSKPSFF